MAIYSWKNKIHVSFSTKKGVVFIILYEKKTCDLTKICLEHGNYTLVNSFLCF